MNCVVSLPGRAVLAVVGEDRVSFLQGLVSNDVMDARPGRAVWAGLLTAQGKWVADFFVHAEGERLLLDVEAGQAEMLMQKLSRYRLRANVTIERTDKAVQVGWGGEVPAKAVADPRLAEAGWRRLGADLLPETCGVEEYDLHRIRLGLPDGSRDMEAEKTTLLEAGFDALHGVSWTKGCYMGQELTARTKYRGLLKRRLMPVRVDGELPAPGTAVLIRNLEIGTMRSGQVDQSGRTGWGLALLRNEALDAAELVCGEARLVPMRPGWMEPARA